MEFVSYGQIFNACGEKKKIFRKALLFRRRRLFARRAPSHYSIFPTFHHSNSNCEHSELSSINVQAI
jgi:hypothetical protein